jgi:hypothetical protein
MKYPQFRDKSKLQVCMHVIYLHPFINQCDFHWADILHLFLATSLVARLVGWQALLQKGLIELQVRKSLSF